MTPHWRAPCPAHLLGLVRVVPGDLLLEPAGGLVVLDAADLRAHDAFERVQHRPGAQAVERRAPLRSRAQVDGVVVTVGEAEAQQQPPCRLGADRVDEFLAQQAHRRSAEDHDPLLVQSDDALIRPEVEQLGEVLRMTGRRVAA